jgi:hypothetical protein
MTTVVRDDFLIVVEGAARLSWCRTGSAQWKPVGLWPTPEQEADVAARVRRGSPVLVVLEDAPAVVPLTDSEAAQVPDDLRGLVEVDGGVGELRIPFLGWLSPELRERGRRFLEQGSATGTPDVLRPPLLIEPPDQDTPHVRFARWLRPGAHPVEALVAVATYLFS